MKIIFEPGSLHVSKRGAITATAYFDFGAGHRFPMFGWNDFVVVISEWWLAEAERISRGQQEGQLRFMDGPYRIDLKAQGADLLMFCVEDRPSVGIVHQETIGLTELVAELAAFGRAVSRACMNAGVSSPDLDCLRKYLG